MNFDYTRQALYFPESKPAFAGFDVELAFDASNTGFAACNAWFLSNCAHLAYYDQDPLRTSLQRVGLELVQTFDRQGSQAFLARTDRFAILAFRGTEPDDLRDAWRDANLILAADLDGGHVHEGFAGALDAIWPELEPHLSELAATATPVWYTGHSLGAAMATLAAARRPPAALYTFGSPRVGDQSFVQRVAESNVYRFVNGADLVTRVPPALAYRHAGELYFLGQTPALSVNPSELAVRLARAQAIASYAGRLPWLRRGWVTARSLTDHAIVNYNAALWHILQTG